MYCVSRPIDFEQLLRRDLTPPFSPEVDSESDVKYVPKTYLQAEVKDSMVEEDQTMTNSQRLKTDHDFKDFNFHEEADPANGRP